MNTKRSFAFAVAALVAMRGFALDLSIDVGAASHSSDWYRLETMPRIVEAVSLGQSLGDSFYFKLDLDHATQVGAGGTAWFQPIESQARITAEFTSDLVYAGATATIDGTPAAARPELGLFARGSLPLVGDLLAVDGELRVAADSGGQSGELRAAPTLYLPLAKPVMVDLGLRLGMVMGNYDGLDYTGLSTLTIRPEFVVNLDRSLGFGIAGGYNLDLSGGRFSSFPFVEATLSLFVDASRE